MAVKRRGNTEWRKLVAECDSSCKTQEEWCIANGINYYTFKDRARRLREMDERGETGPMFRSKERNCWVEVMEPLKGSMAGSGDPDPVESRRDEPSGGDIRIIMGAFTVTVSVGFKEAALRSVINVLSAPNSADAKGTVQ